MVAEMGLKWQDNGQPALLQVSIMYKVPALLLVLLLSLYPCALRAQTTKASITGRVTDPSKATVPDAKVAAVNLGTNSRYESATNGAGEYALANLPPGTYRIEVEKSGFKKLVRPDVILHVTLCAGDRSFAANSLHPVQIGKVYLPVSRLGASDKSPRDGILSDTDSRITASALPTVLH